MVMRFVNSRVSAFRLAISWRKIGEPERAAFGVVENNLRLTLIGRNAQAHAALAAHERVLAQAGEICRQGGHGLRLAAAPADYESRFFNTLQRLAFAARELGEGGALVFGEGFTHGGNEKDAPAGPRIARERAAKELLVGQSLAKGDLGRHGTSEQLKRTGGALPFKKCP
jgi:hypothetical protein